MIDHSHKTELPLFYTLAFLVDQVEHGRVILSRARSTSA